MTDWCDILKRSVCGGLCLMGPVVMVDSAMTPIDGKKKPAAAMAKEDETHRETRGFVKLEPRRPITVVTSTGMLGADRAFIRTM